MKGSPQTVDSAKIAEAAATCACFNFRKASRAVTALFDESLQPAGLRSTQLVILVATYLLQPAAVARLARELVMERSTLTRNLRPLIKLKLIRITAGQDKRTRLVTLTPQGLQTLADAMPLWERAQIRFVQRIGEPRWQELMSGLSATVEAARSS
jgi:DNA-binding MarR family transcriptional regulator